MLSSPSLADTLFSSVTVLQALQGFDEKRVMSTTCRKIVGTLLERKRGKLTKSMDTGGRQVRTGKAGRVDRGRQPGRASLGLGTDRWPRSLPAAQPSKKPTKKLHSECQRSAQ